MKDFENVDRIIIPRSILDKFVSKAINSKIEVGGLLLGKIVKSEALVSKIVIGRNLAESSTRFLLDDESIVKAINMLEDEEDIVGIIHSHITAPYPSALDIEGMRRWPVIWVIVDVINKIIKAWYFNKEIKIVVK